jgi:hypothetical protein
MQKTTRGVPPTQIARSLDTRQVTQHARFPAVLREGRAPRRGQGVDGSPRPKGKVCPCTEGVNRQAERPHREHQLEEHWAPPPVFTVSRCPLPVARCPCSLGRHARIIVVSQGGSTHTRARANTHTHARTPSSTCVLYAPPGAPSGAWAEASDRALSQAEPRACASRLAACASTSRCRRRRPQGGRLA